MTWNRFVKDLKCAYQFYSLALAELQKIDFLKEMWERRVHVIGNFMDGWPGCCEWFLRLCYVLHTCSWSLVGGCLLVEVRMPIGEFLWYYFLEQWVRSSQDIFPLSSLSFMTYRTFRSLVKQVAPPRLTIGWAWNRHVGLGMLISFAFT